jgi:hypothetical protein
MIEQRMVEGATRRLKHATMVKIGQTVHSITPIRLFKLQKIREKTREPSRCERQHEESFGVRAVNGQAKGGKGKDSVHGFYFYSELPSHLILD